MNTAENLLEVEWSWLKPHILRDAVIIVDRSLDLLSVSNEIALDHSMKVKDWIQKGLLKKPSPEQIQSWDQTPQRMFRSVIVQPFVLVQGKELDS